LGIRHLATARCDRIHFRPSSSHRALAWVMGWGFSAL
jgi:hypothetical protein